MHYAVVDIGSNTVRMCVYCVEASGDYMQMHKESRTPELLSHIVDGALSETGVALLCEALRAFTEVADRLNIDKRRAFATAVFRRLADPASLCARLHAETGWQIEVLSGDEEAACSFAGLISRHKHAKNGIMIDMGGGSTEFLSFSDRICTDAISEPFGCVSLRRQFVLGQLPTDAEAEQLRDYVTQTVSAQALQRGTELYLVGGTAKAMGTLYRQVYGSHEMQPKRTAALIRRFGRPSTADFAQIEHYFPSRAYSAVTGMLAYGAILDVLAPSRIHISGAGVREGYLVRHLIGEKKEA